MDNALKETRLQTAACAFKRDPSISIYKLAKMYHIPDKTLCRRIAGVAPKRGSRDTSNKLTETEEQSIVLFIIDLDSRAFPPRVCYVRDMADRLLAERGSSPVGINWISRFINRTPALKTRLDRRIDYSRVLCENPDNYNAYYERIRKTIEREGIAEEDIYNFDETGFMMGMITTNMVVTSVERRNRPRQAQQGNRNWSTAVCAINSRGWAVPPFIILEGKTHLASWYRDSPLPRDWVIAVSDNGWINNDLGLKWIKHFDAYTRPRLVGTKRLLVLDGHESHHPEKFENYCKANSIFTETMPPHSSHRLQPLDVACFSPLKKAYSVEIGDRMRMGITHISKEDFLPAFFNAYMKSMTPENVISGFRVTGLVPFDPKVVISELDITPIASTPSPPPELTPSIWVSKTPTTIKEAVSQSIYLKSRIRTHQQSSPTEIINAVASLSKATYQLMHRHTLVMDRITKFEEANHILSKRRRTKNKRLQPGETLTLNEGIDLQVARESGSAAGQGNGEGTSRRVRATGRARRCGICGNTGHNARTCTADVETSNEEDSD